MVPLPLKRRLPALALLLTACAAAPPVPSTPAAPDLRLTCLDARPHIRGVPPGAAFSRGSWLYFRSPAGVITGVATVSATDPSRGLLEVFGRALATSPLTIPPDGLAAEPVPPDSQARVGAALGNYLGQPGAAYDEAIARAPLLTLTLDLGAGVGVRAGDLYEVYGDPIVDPHSRTLIGFERLARCRVAEGTVLAESAGCALDRRDWPAFERDDWIRGGRVERVDARGALRCP